MITELKVNLYSVKDNVAGQFYTPELSETDGIAIRNYKLIVNSNSKSMLCMRPQDFSLYKVGQYDVKTGVLYPGEVEFVCNLNDLKEDIEHGKTNEA